MAAIANPGPIAQGFGNPNLLITQGFLGGSPPPPVTATTSFEIIEAPFNRLPV